MENLFIFNETFTNSLNYGAVYCIILVTGLCGILLTINRPFFDLLNSKEGWAMAHQIDSLRKNRRPGKDWSNIFLVYIPANTSFMINGVKNTTRARSYFVFDTNDMLGSVPLAIFPEGDVSWFLVDGKVFCGKVFTDLPAVHGGIKRGYDPRSVLVSSLILAAVRQKRHITSGFNELHNDSKYKDHPWWNVLKGNINSNVTIFKYPNYLSPNSHIQEVL